MRALAGQLVDGHVILPGTSLAEGTQVTVIVEDDDAPAWSDSDIAELVASQTAVRAGEFVTADRVFEHLRSKRR